MIEFQHLKLLPLHKHPEYLDACCEMINDEWPRSRTARMMSLSASCDQLPTSLILVDGLFHLLGHAKLTRLPSIPNSSFLETVVISKNMRGKKLGTHLMIQVEEYCKRELKLEMLHLSTKGQENFYAKLGYIICAPVSIYGNVSHTPLLGRNDKQVRTVQHTSSHIPPPPPLPKPQTVSYTTQKSSKTFMFKYLQ